MEKVTKYTFSYSRRDCKWISLQDINQSISKAIRTFTEKKHLGVCLKIKTEAEID